MKKSLYFLSILFLTTTCCNSQNWMPFIGNQTSYYQQVINGQIHFESFKIDSTFNDTEVVIQFFNFKNSVCSNCDSLLRNMPINTLNNSFYKYIPYLRNEVYFNQDIHDRLYISGDSIIYGDSSRFIFKPLTNIGQYWETNNIRIECISMDTTLIFGTVDSIKVFQCQGGNFDGIQIILSKSNGLLEFIPFNSFITNEVRPVFKLIGIDNIDSSKGYNPKNILKKVSFQNGDKKVWKGNKGIDGKLCNDRFWVNRNLLIDTTIVQDIINPKFLKKYMVYEGGDDLVCPVYKPQDSFVEEDNVKLNELIQTISLGNFSINTCSGNRANIYYARAFGEINDNADTITNIRIEKWTVRVSNNDFLCNPDYWINVDDYTQIIVNSEKGLITNNWYEYYWAHNVDSVVGSVINGVEEGDLTYLYCDSYSIIEVEVCNNYLSPSNKYTWTASGTYYDTIPNSVGCDSILTIDLQIENCMIYTSDPEYRNIEVSPNPTNGKVKIHLEPSFENAKIDVFNQLGQNILTEESNEYDNIELDIIGSSGLYIIEIKSETGERYMIKVLKN